MWRREAEANPASRSGGGTPHRSLSSFPHCPGPIPVPPPPHHLRATVPLPRRVASSCSLWARGHGHRSAVVVASAAAAAAPAKAGADEVVLQPIKEISGVVKLPGSKSLSNRILLLFALAEEYVVRMDAFSLPSLSTERVATLAGTGDPMDLFELEDVSLLLHLDLEVDSAVSSLTLNLLYWLIYMVTELFAKSVT